MSPAGGGTGARRRCRVTTGFFVLEPCGAPGTAACSRCSRTLCARHQHLLPGATGPTCPECTAAARGTAGDLTDDLWEITFRRGFYWELSQHTGDESWWVAFDSYDREAFTFDDQLGDAIGDAEQDVFGAADGETAFDDVSAGVADALDDALDDSLGDTFDDASGGGDLFDDVAAGVADGFDGSFGGEGSIDS